MLALYATLIKLAKVETTQRRQKPPNNTLTFYSSHDLFRRVLHWHTLPQSAHQDTSDNQKLLSVILKW